MTRMAGSIKGVTDFLGVKPEYGEMAAENIGRRAQEFARVTQGNALAANAGMKGLADIQSAQAYADAGVAAGQAAGQASMVGGIASGISGLAGGFSKVGAGGGASSAGYSFGGSNVLGGAPIGDYSGGLSGTPIPGMFG